MPTIECADAVLSHRADTPMSYLSRILAERACSFYVESPGSHGIGKPERRCYQVSEPVRSEVSGSSPLVVKRHPLGERNE